MKTRGGRDSDLIRFHKHFIGNLTKGDDKVKGESARETNLFFPARVKKEKKNDAWLNEIMKSSSVTSTAPPSGN